MYCVYICDKLNNIIFIKENTKERTKSLINSVNIVEIDFCQRNFPWFISIYLSARPVLTNRFIDKYFCQYSPRYSPFSTSCKVFFNVYGIAIKYKFWNAHLNCLEIEICFLFNRGIFEPFKSFFPSKLGKFVCLKYDDYKYTYNIVCILWDIVRIIR